MNPATPSSWSLQGTRVLVTGATGGIGAAIVHELLSLGGSVVATGRKPENLEQLRATENADKRLAIVTADATQPADREKIARFCTETFGGLDAFVGNHGIAHRAPAVSTTEDDLARVWATNVTSILELARALHPLFAKSPAACMVFVGSVTGRIAIPNRIAYSASKAGLEAAMRGLAVELGPKGIRTNAVLPYFIRTPMAARILDDETQGRAIAEGTPLRRPGEPEEVARAVAFLCLPAASFINGHALIVDGGFLAQGLPALA